MNEFHEAQIEVMDNFHEAHIEMMERGRSRGLLISCTDADWATIVDFIMTGTRAEIFLRAVSAGDLQLVDTPPEPRTNPPGKWR